MQTMQFHARKKCTDPTQQHFQVDIMCDHLFQLNNNLLLVGGGGGIENMCCAMSA